jgi:hypothetical protein
MDQFPTRTDEWWIASEEAGVFTSGANTPKLYPTVWERTMQPQTTTEIVKGGLPSTQWRIDNQPTQPNQPDDEENL